MNCERRRLTRKPRIRWEYKVRKNAVKLLHTRRRCAAKRNWSDWRKKQGGHNQETDQEALEEGQMNVRWDVQHVFTYFKFTVVGILI